MAIKYRRTTEAAILREQEQGPGAVAWLITMDPRHKLLLVYFGISVCALIIYFAQTAANRAAARSDNLHHGAAVIIEKRPPQLLRMRMATTSGKLIELEAEAEASAWDRFQPGDRIGLVYRQNWSGSQVEVVELGLFALPD